MAKVNIRLKNGKFYNIKDVTFVEVCNEEGMLSAIVYLANDGTVHIHGPEDDQFKRYSSMYRRKATTMLQPEELNDTD